MDNRAEVRDFLITRRAKLRPADSGLAVEGHRRVPGLRRGEVANLAGVSVEYYSKLERGFLQGVSTSVLDAVARALQLDAAETEYLFNLARSAGSSMSSRAPRRENPWRPSTSLQWALDVIHDAPVIVTNGRSDLLATNKLGRAVYADMFTDPTTQPNFARFTFLDATSHTFYPDWDYFADMTVANLRTEAGRRPNDRQLHELVGEMSTRSDEFRRRWSAHNVRIHVTGQKHYYHPVVGDLMLGYESFDLHSDAALSMTIYAAEPGSPSERALQLLGSWSAEPVNHKVTTSPEID